MFAECLEDIDVHLYYVGCFFETERTGFRIIRIEEVNFQFYRTEDGFLRYGVASNFYAVPVVHVLLDVRPEILVDTCQIAFHIGIQLITQVEQLDSQYRVEVIAAYIDMF